MFTILLYLMSKQLYRHGIIDILWEVALKTITLTPQTKVFDRVRYNLLLTCVSLQPSVAQNRYPSIHRHGRSAMEATCLTFQTASITFDDNIYALLHL
jgi:hypothetical protein